MYEKFDTDFNKACKDIGIVPENTRDEDIENETINCSTMSALFAKLGFADSNGNE
jgi:hypothetical protein